MYLDVYGHRVRLGTDTVTVSRPYLTVFGIVHPVKIDSFSHYGCCYVSSRCKVKTVLPVSRLWILHAIFCLDV